MVFVSYSDMTFGQPSMDQIHLLEVYIRALRRPYHAVWNHADSGNGG